MTTLDEFIERCRDFRDASHWRIDLTGKIVSAIGRSPLLVVASLAADNTTHREGEAARALGLSVDDGMAISRACSAGENFDRDLRAKIVAALDLTETYHPEPQAIEAQPTPEIGLEIDFTDGDPRLTIGYGLSAFSFPVCVETLAELQRLCGEAIERMKG